MENQSVTSARQTFALHLQSLATQPPPPAPPHKVVWRLLGLVNLNHPSTGMFIRLLMLQDAKLKIYTIFHQVPRVLEISEEMPEIFLIGQILPPLEICSCKANVWFAEVIGFFHHTSFFFREMLFSRLVLKCDQVIK